MRARTLVLCVALCAALAAPGLSGARAEAPSDSTRVAPNQTKRNDAQVRERATSNDDLEALRRAAAAEAEKKPERDTGAGETTFKSGGLSLQALNPELSVAGDMLGTYQSGRDDDVAWDTEYRSLSFHLQSYLDPYSRFKAALPISAEGIELEEAYFTRYGLWGNTNLTLGRFRQQLGVVNRWHDHALDWFGYPMALTAVFGDDGLTQTGLALEWGGSTGRIVHGLIVEVTDAENDVMFGQNARNRPSILGHYKAYQDLSPSTYLEVGLTGLVGWNDDWSAAVDSTFSAEQTASYTSSDPRVTAVYGIDLTMTWEPTDRMRYRNVQWRSEAYFVDKEIYAPDGSGVDQLTPWGVYSLLQTKLTRTIDLGVRYDYFAPNTKSYASRIDAPMPVPLAVETGDAYRQLVGGWVTWWQSPFVRFRGGYSYESGNGTGPDVNTIMLQTVFAAGPHKHERY